MKQIIGIAGPKGSGKDTLAGVLWERLISYPAAIKPLAGPVKDATAAAFGWKRWLLDDPEFKETVDPRYGVTPRYAMQMIGTELPRLMGVDNLWVERLRAEVHDPFYADGVVIVPDVRREHEAVWIKSEGGIILHVHRSGVRYSEEHETECQLPFKYLDYDVFNSSEPRDMNVDLDLVSELKGL
jgi:hypothetical protein